jgi:hypothetical protein
MRKAVEIVGGAVKAVMVELRSNGRHDLDGFEHLDDTPVAIPLNASRPESLSETIARLLVSAEFQKSLNSGGFETEEEANNFDLPGEEIMKTAFEEAGDEELDRLIVDLKKEVRKRENEKKLAGGVRAGEVSPSVGAVEGQKASSGGGSASVGSVVSPSK